VEYVGSGRSKKLAKNDVAEKVLMHLGLDICPMSEGEQSPIVMTTPSLQHVTITPPPTGL
jgi:hypothetical protein